MTRRQIKLNNKANKSPEGMYIGRGLLLCGVLGVLLQFGCASAQREPAVIISPEYNHNNQPEVIVTQPELIEAPLEDWNGDVIAQGPDASITTF